MSVPVEYLPEAEDDIDWTYRWYEHQRTGLGEDFVLKLRMSIDTISNNPKMYGIYRRKIRTAPVKRFPYFVYYVDRGDDVLVIAVAHGRRSQRAWRGRRF
ncbi:hypothetical protein BH11PLA2_BH11PLA2_25950 [soil metagenome]